MSEKLESRKLRKADGTVMYVWNNKLHNWDGPALIPGDDKKKAEYYLFGIKYSKEEWESRKKDVNGVPFHKTSAGKQTGTRV